MRKIAAILLVVGILFIAEFIFYNIGGSFFLPNLLILAVIFFDLTLGIRYGLFTAFLSGLMHDVFSIGLFGTQIFIFICCAYLATVLRKSFYQAGSQSSRLQIVFLVSTAYVFISYLLNLRHGMIVAPFDVLLRVWLPEVVLTLVLASTIFNYLRQCALRFSIFS
jgi:rod shape-determining protein MreD